jgi:hypothetical protein
MTLIERNELLQEKNNQQDVKSNNNETIENNIHNIGDAINQEDDENVFKEYQNEPILDVENYKNNEFSGISLSSLDKDTLDPDSVHNSSAKIDKNILGEVNLDNNEDLIDTYSLNNNINMDFDINLSKNSRNGSVKSVSNNNKQKEFSTNNNTSNNHSVSDNSKIPKLNELKQIAKSNNRMLLLVDVSSVKSKWVGESEKNIKRVFNEYRQAVKFYGESPILFFNECDALISKRNDVQSSVDQMNNTMQNILLQELEDFKGIFVATTNLIQNIDKAFDRRILYKLHLDEPENETRFKILKSHFPNYSDSLLLEISNKHHLTGGQIQNLKKKFLVEQILFKNLESTEENFKNYIESELNFRKNKKKSIGFS